MKDLNYYLERKYPLFVVQEDDGSYFVEYPDLKGCFSTGDTLEEAVQLSYDAKKAWIETAIDENIEIPTPKATNKYSGNFKLRMPKSLHKSLADAAKEEGISMNQYCIYLLSKELEHGIKQIHN
ncbi:MAG TPA: toxin-antitoxin system HicB family antitoxin [Clostridiales bacterium]|nr:toxin-antitoxin system HicB family antitoxin [Clostridiales bacterium]